MVNIRLAVPSDASDIAEILMRSWEAAYGNIIPTDFIEKKNAMRAEQFKRAITEENNTYYILQKDDKTAGYMRVVNVLSDNVFASEISDLEQIYLHPDYYRQGIGTRAMDFAYNTALSSGKTVMIVWVLAENTAAIKFYKKCGFIADGEEKQREYGKVLTIIRMRKSLKQNKSPHF